MKKRGTLKVIKGLLFLFFTMSVAFGVTADLLSDPVHTLSFHRCTLMYSAHPAATVFTVTLPTEPNSGSHSAFDPSDA